MTYPLLSVVVLAVIAAVTLPLLRRERAAPLWWTALVLVVLTLVFDNIIVGVGIVGYDDDKISGLRVPYAPIEDFSYALAAVVVVPVLWKLLGRLAPRDDGRSNDAT